jgi:hypothetical protein
MANLGEARINAPSAAGLAPRRKLVTSTTTRNYLSESSRAGRKVFFDFAVLPEHAKGTDSTDSTDYTVRFNGYRDFVASSRQPFH